MQKWPPLKVSVVQLDSISFRWPRANPLLPNCRFCPIFEIVIYELEWAIWRPQCCRALLFQREIYGDLMDEMDNVCSWRRLLSCWSPSCYQALDQCYQTACSTSVDRIQQTTLSKLSPVQLSKLGARVGVGGWGWEESNLRDQEPIDQCLCEGLEHGAWTDGPRTLNKVVGIRALASWQLQRVSSKTRKEFTASCGSHLNRHHSGFSWGNRQYSDSCEWVWAWKDLPKWREVLLPSFTECNLEVSTVDLLNIWFSKAKNGGSI